MLDWDLTQVVLVWAGAAEWVLRDRLLSDGDVAIICGAGAGVGQICVVGLDCHHEGLRTPIEILNTAIAQ